MKRLLTIALLALSASAFSQGVVKNGTIYKQHPYITAVLQLNASFAKGDTIAVAKFYADTARFIDATNPMKPSNLAQAKATWHDILLNWDFVSIKQIGYPDGLEYANDPFTVRKRKRKRLLSKWYLIVLTKQAKSLRSYHTMIPRR